MCCSKCASVIKNVIGPHFKANLAQDIGDSYYSLIIDESTDVTVATFLAISIIYHSVTNSTIVTTFLNLFTFEVCTADRIVVAVKSTLLEYFLNMERIRGIATENASVMTGINNGVHRKLKGEALHLVLIHRVCHSLQLATLAATVEALPRKLEYLISEKYNLFTRSPARQIAYKKLYGLINDGDEPLKIVQVCRTRWLSLEIAVSRIVDQWTELKAHFEIARRTKKYYAAEVLCGMYENQINLGYLLFLRPIVTDAQKVNKAFEAKDADQTKLLKGLVTLFLSLVLKFLIPTMQMDVLTSRLEDHLNHKPYLRNLFEAYVDNMKTKKTDGFSLADEAVMRESCIRFITTLVDQIRQ
ncbi:hypothetical protein HPB49_014427 [Dermacentor silvarum]|uniref:Uncharacterized protein n=1 Tax=Dermacentor silvarum TaxID=543639 RepID=A0ACB8D6H5_DERSI|nr:hypothetical protein HPB49_014427 [Dermacentor silvarum]